ncbi:MAG: AEC family transporter [Clostridia bacterium]|nr:AEC family transporter [Clostridia bacterium]
MEVFNLTLTQMLVMFVLMLTGCILQKGKFLPENSSAVVSKLLVFVLSPALTLSNQIKMCTPQNLLSCSKFMLYSIVIVAVAMAISYPLSALFIKNRTKDPAVSYQRQIYKYALTFSNFAYMGNYIVLGIWGDEMLFKYIMFTFLMNAIVLAWGLYILVPKSKNSKSIWSNLKTGLLTPPFLAMVLGIILGVTGASRFVPLFMTTALENAGNCMGPVAMLLAGMVVGGYKFSELLKNKKVYLTTLLRLIIIPAIFVSVLKLLGAAEEIVILTLIAYATPMGLNTIVYPAAYGGDTKTGASMAMISNILAVGTIPLMYYLFIILL